MHKIAYAKTSSKLNAEHAQHQLSIRRKAGDGIPFEPLKAYQGCRRLTCLSFIPEALSQIGA